MAIVERLKQESMYDNVIAIVERWPISGLVRLYLNYNIIKLGPFPGFFENGSVFSLQKMTEAKRNCSAATNFLLIQSFNFTRLATYFVPCEQWFFLAGCYATKGEN